MRAAFGDHETSDLTGGEALLLQPAGGEDEGVGGNQLYQTSARKSGVDLVMKWLHKSTSNMQLMPDNLSQNDKINLKMKICHKLTNPSQSKFPRIS